MRRIVQASMGAALAFAVLVGGAGAQPLGAAGATGVRVTPQARVIKPFGAALRSDPSSESSIIFSLQCGDILPVIGFQDGWVQVQDGDIEGWVGGARVSVGQPPAPADCRAYRPMYLGSPVTTQVATGCLSLRSEPSREARILACVDNGHEYTLIDGPFDPGTGEDWFRVYSARTGPGWTLAQYLYPEQ